MTSGEQSSLVSEDGQAPRIKRRGVAIVGKTMWMFVLAAVLLIALFIGVFPTRAFLDQRDAISAAEADLVATRSQIESLEARIDDFNDRVAVARIARERFSLVFPDEELFRLTTRPSDAVQLPDGWMWPAFERLVKG
jgi:cell division protein FtsB